MSLVLAIFPGIDVLGLGFEREGYCVVRGPDVIFGGDIRNFKPPAGVFDGVIGGDPCQSHSALANLVRAKGLEPSFPDMTPEFERVVNEARPRWFLRENVPRAPDVKPESYDVRTFVLDHSTLDSGDGTGHEQMRKRRFWFGVRDGQAPELRQWIDFALTVLPDRAVAVGSGHDYIDGAEPIERYRTQAIAGDPPRVPVALGGSGKPKPTHRHVAIQHAPVQATRERERNTRANATATDGRHGHRAASVTGRHPGEIGVTGGHAGHPPRYSLAEMLDLQGLPRDFLDHAPWTMQGKRKAVGNSVPLGMARALARAIRRWQDQPRAGAG